MKLFLSKVEKQNHIKPTNFQISSHSENQIRKSIYYAPFKRQLSITVSLIHSHQHIFGVTNKVIP